MANILNLLSAITGAPTTGTAVDSSGPAAYQAVVSGTGAVTATVIIEVSNDGTNFLTLGTIALSGTTTATEGFSATTKYAYTRARLIDISGTNATVTVKMGV